VKQGGILKQAAPGPLKIGCTPLTVPTDPESSTDCISPGDDTPTSSVTAYVAIDATFLQTWNLVNVTIGDLATTMSLAPGEQLTIEFQSSQRKTLEESTLDSNESLRSTESTTSDKEAINIARSSSATQGWHVDSTATVSVGFASLSVTGGAYGSVTTANQQAINQIHDTTLHSAQSVKALHKIEVRGVSEGIVQNRLTRVITNPYYDQTLVINVFHLLKHFSVETKLAELRAAIVFQIDGLQFDKCFVLRFGDFLRENLLDSSLLDQLPTAILGAQPPLQPTYLSAAIDTAQRALAYLYNYDGRAPDLFSFPPKYSKDPGLTVDQNDPATSFKQNLMGVDAAGNPKAVGADNSDFGHSGWGAAEANKCTYLHAILGFFYAVIQKKMQNVPILQVSDNAVRIASALATSAEDAWKKLFTDPKESDTLNNLVNEVNLTEVIRRVPGFLAMVNGMLKPLLDPANLEQDGLIAYAQANYVLQRLLTHLECNRHYYVQRFLRYIADVTRRQAIIDFAVDAVTRLNKIKPLKIISIGDLDFDRTFIDKREIVVPAITPLDNKTFSKLVSSLLSQAEEMTEPDPAVAADLEVPCDGVHLEVTQGSCPPLAKVPPPSRLQGTVTVDKFDLSLGGKGS